jgi:hypothetical protein
VTHIDELRETIQRLHGTDSRHIHSVPVKEMWEGGTIWEGVVEVFELDNHPKASKVYAWAHDTGDPERPTRHVTVLHGGPITSALDAVRASIFKDYNNRAEEA